MQEALHVAQAKIERLEAAHAEQQQELASNVHAVSAHEAELAEYRRMLAAEADAGKRTHSELKHVQAQLQQSEEKVESLEGQMEALQART